ncbi:MAG TPA: VanW family protein [Candidatus Magasanikbacteria bacterium]|nr:VanW family protein [Candidatus Magasanikbacteria bacterium]
MSEDKQEKAQDKSRWSLWVVVIIFACLFFVLAGFFALLSQLPANVVARGVTVGQVDLGGLSKEQAERIVTKQIETMENHGVSFVYKNVSLNLASVNHSLTNPEISNVIFDYDSETTVQKALSMGRTGNRLNQIFSRLYLRLFGIKIEPTYSFVSEEALNFLRENLSTYETEFKNAALQVKNNSNLELSIQEESAGKSFNYQLALKELKNRLDNFDLSDISLKLEEAKPTITKAEAEKKTGEVSEILSKGKITFQSGDKNFIVEPGEWAQWLVLKKEKNKLVVAVDEDKLKNYLQTKVFSEIETDFEEAKFVIENGKVKEFKPGQSGKKINLIVVLKSVEEALLNNGDRNIILVMETVDPELTLEKVNSFGVRELLGVGKTNFKGSSANRKKNIAAGAKILNGILIAPGEVFSTITRLKPIDETNGYVPELVIKGSKTVPEFGGGLCQVSTTLFRAVLSSGLPVLERAAHAYRVSYYEPPVGVDATIYDPSPDFRFINDTGNYILVQGRIEGTELIFEFWGTKDGRSVKKTDPQVYNIKAPPEAKLIETLDLPVGQKKCTESAHAGADAIFNYTITYTDGTIKDQEFKSHYRPWGSVCYIGVEKLTEPAETDSLLTSTSTVPDAPNSPQGQATVASSTAVTSIVVTP